MKYPELIPSGAKLIYSEVKPGFYEFHKYEYTVKLSGEAYTSEVSVSFNENLDYMVTLRGKDRNEELLSFRWNLHKLIIQYNWTIPDITQEDNLILKKIAEQFAAAYGSY